MVSGRSTGQCVRLPGEDDLHQELTRSRVDLLHAVVGFLMLFVFQPLMVAIKTDTRAKNLTDGEDVNIGHYVVVWSYCRPTDRTEPHGMFAWGDAMVTDGNGVGRTHRDVQLVRPRVWCVEGAPPRANP